MTIKFAFTGLLCAFVAVSANAASFPLYLGTVIQASTQKSDCDPIGAAVNREAGDRAREARELAGSAGGSGRAGTLTVERGSNGEGFVVKAGGSVEHFNSIEAAKEAVEKYKRDGYKFSGHLR